jgi:hypothetical protein
MQHHNYRTIQTVMREVCRAEGIPVPTTDELRTTLVEREQHMEKSSHTMMVMHFSFNEKWIEEKQPYYLLYPSIIPMLTRLALDRVESQMLKIPHGLNSMLIRFPVGLDREVRSIWMYEAFLNHRKHGECKAVRGMIVGIDHGEMDPTGTQPVFLIRAFPLSSDSIEEALEALPKSWTAAEGKQLDPQEIIDAVRIACTVCLLDGNPDLVAPEVLSKDERKVSQDNVDQLVDKAKRRGKFGWSLGRDMEITPHYRRPHPALVWVDKGRVTPKIVMRSGSIVHRETVEKVPTGYGITSLAPSEQSQGDDNA